MVAKLRSMWDYGVFLGVRPWSNKTWVATVDASWKVQRVRQRPQDVSWSSDSATWVRRTMWNQCPGEEQADEDILESKSVELPQEMKDDLEEQGLTFVTKRQVPREFHMSEKDAVKHRYTRDCAGCGNWFRGMGMQPHSAECRKRCPKLLSDDARVQFVNQKVCGSKKKKLRENEERNDENVRKKQEDEEEKYQKRRFQSRGSSDGVVVGGGVERKMDYTIGNDQMQMEAEEIFRGVCEGE